MRPLVWVTSILILLIGSNGRAADLGGHFGVGVNWEGVQIKYGFSDEYLGEVRAQMAENNTIAGARFYRLFPEISRKPMAIKPYLGAEIDGVFSDYVNGGVLSGGFAGLEIMPMDHLGIELDAGLYYQNLWSCLGGISDVGVIVNLGITFFF